MRILVTGSREWENNTRNKLMFNSAMDLVMRGYDVDNIELVIGDCPTGLDLIAREWVGFFGFKHKVFYADWTQHGKAAGPLRNQEMVDYISDVPISIAVAFPMPGAGNRGTTDCTNRVLREGIKLVQRGATA